MKIFKIVPNVIYSNVFYVRAKSKDDAKLCICNALENGKISIDDFSSYGIEFDFISDGFADDEKHHYDLSSDMEANHD